MGRRDLPHVHDCLQPSSITFTSFCVLHVRPGPGTCNQRLGPSIRTRLGSLGREDRNCWCRWRHGFPLRGALQRKSNPLTKLRSRTLLTNSTSSLAQTSAPRSCSLALSNHGRRSTAREAQISRTAHSGAPCTAWRSASTTAHAAWHSALRWLVCSGEISLGASTSVLGVWSLHVLICLSLLSQW